MLVEDEPYEMNPQRERVNGLHSLGNRVSLIA